MRTHTRIGLHRSSKVYFNWTPFQKDQAWHGLPLSYRALFPVFSIDPRERQAHEAGARTRATAHERTPQQERQKAAREAERGREAWTLGQGMKKPVAGCYGRLTRWKGGGDVVYMALL